MREYFEFLRRGLQEFLDILRDVVVVRRECCSCDDGVVIMELHCRSSTALHLRARLILIG